MVSGGSGREKGSGSWWPSGPSVGVCAEVVSCWLVLHLGPRFVCAHLGWLGAGGSVRGVGLGLGAGRILALAAPVQEQPEVLLHC